MISLKHSLKVFSLVFLVASPVFAMEEEARPAASSQYTSRDSQTAASSAGLTYQLVQNIYPEMEHSDKGFWDNLGKDLKKSYVQVIAALIVELSMGPIRDLAVAGYNRARSKIISLNSEDRLVKPTMQELIHEMTELSNQDEFLRAMEKHSEKQEQDQLKSSVDPDAIKIVQDHRKNIAAIRMELLQKSNEISNRMRAEFVPKAQFAA
jgi:hypothetical protein